MTKKGHKTASAESTTQIRDISLERLSDRIPAMIALYSLATGKYKYVSKAITKLLGYKPIDFTSRGLNFVVSLVHPDDLPVIMEKNEAALKKILVATPTNIDKEPIVNFEYRMKHKKGHWVWLHTDGSIYDWTSDGKVSHLLNVSIDITERKETELRLRELSDVNLDELKKTQAALDQSDKRYQAFISNSNEGIWRCELEVPLSISLSMDKQIKHMYKYGYLAEANDAMAKMYGAKNSNMLVGLRLNKLLVEDDPKNTEYLQAFIKSGYRLSGVESHEKDSKGNDKYFRNSLVGIVKNGKLLRAWGTQQDVTDQVQSLEALRLSEERLALAMQVSKMGIWEWDMITQNLHWPPELKRLFGLKTKDKITYEKYLAALHPEERDEMQVVIKNAIKSGKTYQVDHRVLWPDGSVHWVQGQGQTFYKDGKPVKMLGTTRDITAAKLAENALIESEQRYKTMLEEQHALVELNDAKDEFITLASHQLRTPATGVKQFIGMLLENYFGEMTDDQRTMLEYAYESNERQLEVINDLLKVAQVDAGKVVLDKQKTDMADLLENILQEQRSQFAKRKQRVLLDRPTDPIYAVADKSRIRMVVENLIDNASKYTPEGKSIMVSVDTADKGKTVVLKVKDEGVGIAKEDMAKLFQKFSRLDNPLSIQVGGTGIGLYWAKKIIDLHNGTVQLKSTLGKGTTFIVKIPA